MIAHYFVVISLDSKLACRFYKYLSEECSTAIQKEKRLCTSPRDLNFFGLK